MTRQKRELLKHIQQMERSIETDTQLGLGYTPPGAFDRVYEKIYELREELAHLRHYASVEEMLCDTRGQVLDMDIPW